jgi:hypothetical protein
MAPFLPIFFVAPFCLALSDRDPAALATQQALTAGKTVADDLKNIIVRVNFRSFTCNAAGE